MVVSQPFTTFLCRRLIKMADKSIDLFPLCLEAIDVFGARLKQALYFMPARRRRGRGGGEVEEEAEIVKLISFFTRLIAQRES